MITIFGYLAAITGFITLWPQVYKTYKLKSVSDLSFSMWSLLLLTNTLWMAHGISINDFALIVANVVSGLATITMLIMQMKYRYNVEK